MEKLRIYQSSLNLIEEVYKLVADNHKLMIDYSLSDQLKRASISVLANIAEGYKRSLKHNRNYLNISSGSCNEIVALMQVVERIYNIDTKSIQEKTRLLGKQINSYSKVIS